MIRQACGHGTDHAGCPATVCGSKKTRPISATCATTSHSPRAPFLQGFQFPDTMPGEIDRCVME
jgi:hypothetical protein